MNVAGAVIQDVIKGWRARPLTSIALAALGLSVGLACGLGVHTWRQADQQSRTLLSNWPADRVTLSFRRELTPEEVQFLNRSLPKGQWWSRVTSDQVLWVGGNPPADVFQGTGQPLPPEVIQQATPAGWASPHSGLTVGELGHHQGIAFQVWGVGPLIDSATYLLPRGLYSPTVPPPEYIEVRATPEDLRLRISILPFAEDIELLDHQQKRREARAGFRRLTRNLTLLGVIAGGLTALLCQALIRFELRERRTEFALRRSLGARPEDILFQILTETLLTTGLPAFTGVLILLPWTQSFSTVLLLLIPLWFLLSALPPARQAARTPPHLALKDR